MEQEKFIDRLKSLFKERGTNFSMMEYTVGVSKQTIYRGVKTRSTLAAIAYFLQMSVEDMVSGTDVEALWYSPDKGLCLGIAKDRGVSLDEKIRTAGTRNPQISQSLTKFEEARYVR